MCRSKDFTFTTTHLVRPPQACFMLACLGFWNTRVNRGCGTWRKSRLLGGTASLGLGPGGWVCVRALPCRKRTLFLVGNVDSRDWHRIGGKCVGTSGRCDVSRQKHVHPKTSASRSEFCSSRDHTHPLSACHDTHHERTTIPENTFFERNGLFTQRVKRYGCVAHVDVR